MIKLAKHKSVLIAGIFFLLFSLGGKGQEVTPKNNSKGQTVASVAGSKKKSKKHKKSSKISLANGQKKIILKGEKTISYYTLGKIGEKKATSISIIGPGKLTVDLRVVLDDKTDKSSRFEMIYVKDHKKQTSKTIEELKKASNFQYNNKPVSVAYKKVIEVPPGKHMYKFYTKDNRDTVCVNFSYKKEPKPKWLDTPPINQVENVILFSADKKDTLGYYRISDKLSFKVMAKSSKYIRLIVRQEFKQNELAMDKISLIVKQNDKILTTYHIKSKRSSKMIYKKESNMVPGRKEEIYIKVPETTDLSQPYEFLIADKGKSALIRLSIDSHVDKNEKK